MKSVTQKKKKKKMKENEEFIFLIGFETVFCGSNFCDIGPKFLILYSAKIKKISP